MDAGALRQEIAALMRLLHGFSNTAMVGTPYVEEYDRVLDRLAELGIAELGIDLDAFRVTGAVRQGAAEVDRRYLLTQMLTLASRLRNRLKRMTRSGRAPGLGDPRLN
jgi:hypothetical protein